MIGQKIKKEFFRKGTVLLIVLLMSLVWGPKHAFSVDVLSVIQQAEEKYAVFEKQVVDMSISYEVENITPQEQMISELKVLKKGKKFRIETIVQVPQREKKSEMRQIEVIVIYDGENTWMLSPLAGKRKLTGKEATQFKTEKNWWELISEKAEIVGVEKVNKRECYIIKPGEKTESPFNKMWIDTEALLLIKAEGKTPYGQMMQWIYSDFRLLGGNWKIPHRIETYVDDSLVSTSRIKYVEINSGLSDDLFSPDKVAQTKGFEVERRGD